MVLCVMCITERACSTFVNNSPVLSITATAFTYLGAAPALVEHKVQFARYRSELIHMNEVFTTNVYNNVWLTSTIGEC